MGKPKKVEVDDDDAVFAQRALELKGARRDPLPPPPPRFRDVTPRPPDDRANRERSRDATARRSRPPRAILPPPSRRRPRGIPRGGRLVTLARPLDPPDARPDARPPPAPPL